MKKLRLPKVTKGPKKTANICTITEKDREGCKFKEWEKIQTDQKRLEEMGDCIWRLLHSPRFEDPKCTDADKSEFSGKHTDILRKLSDEQFKQSELKEIIKQVNEDDNVQEEAKKEYENLLTAANAFYNRNLAYVKGGANENILIDQQKELINKALCSGTLSSNNRVSVNLLNDMKLDDKFVKRTEKLRGLRITKSYSKEMIKVDDILHKINSTDVSNMMEDAANKKIKATPRPCTLELERPGEECQKCDKTNTCDAFTVAIIKSLGGRDKLREVQAQFEHPKFRRDERITRREFLQEIKRAKEVSHSKQKLQDPTFLDTVERRRRQSKDKEKQQKEEKDKEKERKEVENEKKRVAALEEAIKAQKIDQDISVNDLTRAVTNLTKAMSAARLREDNATMKSAKKHLQEMELMLKLKKAIASKKLESLNTAIKEAEKHDDVSKSKTYKEAVKERDAAQKTREGSKVVKGKTVQSLEERVIKLETQHTALETKQTALEALARQLSEFGQTKLDQKMQEYMQVVDAAIEATNEKLEKADQEVGKRIEAAIEKKLQNAKSAELQTQKGWFGKK